MYAQAYVHDLQKTVFVRIVIMKLGEIDTVKETFAADIFIQARWREPKLDGEENATKRVRLTDRSRK
jgi:hypothetical protein